ncbi:hypothetical protein NSK_003663 [Nannochloropsis salina CCMP1776]|uniref:Uncharacterized protein n=1 Tax=Nannochloropsis salina CCMP1776 TaxID=1027361 RepID=A0A4D9D1F0_9STRA|nr:hypothetical protein NSK_003663 [Nannochloropsis salina CCMP1776]|eukprot:TFJ85240.1 hypothetical protein NSK_003663 [Nannochloropsis salina CCMP1776]
MPLSSSTASKTERYRSIVEEEIFPDSIRPAVSPGGSPSSLDSAGEQRMGEDMLHMIQQDEDTEEARERAAFPDRGTEMDGEREEEGDGEEDEGAGKEELQSLVMRLLLHSAEAGAPFEPDLEEDLRGLVGSNLFDEIFGGDEAETSKGRGGWDRREVDDRHGGAGALGSASRSRHALRAGVRRRSSEGSGASIEESGGSIGESGETPRKLVAALAGLQFPRTEVGGEAVMEGAARTMMGTEDGEAAIRREDGGHVGRERAGKSSEGGARPGKVSVEDKEEDEICLIPATLPPALPPSRPPLPSHVAGGMWGSRRNEAEDKEEETDTWVNDLEPGYEEVRLSAQEFFDLEEAALEEAQRSLTAKRRLHDGEASDREPGVRWMEEDLQAAEKMMREGMFSMKEDFGLWKEGGREGGREG